jgi:hypothetical protein
MTPNTEQRILSDLTQIKTVLHKLDVSVNGNGNQPGLKIKVDRHDRSINFARKVGWCIMTPVLAAVGGGVIYLITHAK